MEIALMLLSLPLMMLGGFVLDAFGSKDDDVAEDEPDPSRTAGDTDLPPII